MARLDRGLSKQRLYYNPIRYSSPIEFVQQASGHNPNTTASGPFTVSATLPNTPSASNTLIAVCGGMDMSSFSGSTLSWITDKYSGVADVGSCAIFRVPSDGSTTSFTFTGTPATGYAADMWLWLVEVYGLSASPLDATTSGAGAATTWAATLAANRASNELEIFAADSYNGGSLFQCTNGVEPTFVGNTGSTGTYPNSLFIGTKLTNQFETPSTTLSWSSSAEYGAVGASYHGNLPVVPPALVLGQAVKLAATF